MSRPNPANLGAFLTLLLAVSALPVWVKGGLYITNFEGDALHLADIALRMADGEAIHASFMTPIGVLAFWPFQPFLRAGIPLGLSFALGQALFAVPVAVALWHAAATRLPAITAYLFGGASVLILTSLAHGHDSANVAVSMHYNRWAWGAAFAAILLTVLHPRGTARPWLDGAIAGLLLAGLAYLKITYFVAFAPALVLIALLRRDIAFLGAAVAGGALGGVALVLGFGWEHAMAYLADLQAVRDAPLRDAPGLDWPDLLISPAFIAPTLLAIGAGVWLRRSGRRVAGLSILILLPAFVFVTWQNFGNDPLWLIVLSAVLAAVYDTDRTRLRGAAVMAAVAAALAAPMLAVHVPSGIRLLALDEGRYTPLVPGRADLADIYMPNLPAHLVRARTVLNAPGGPFAALGDRIEASDPVTVASENLPECQVLTGIKGTVEALATDLAPDEHPIFAADILSSHWLYSGAPLPGAGPWNYGRLDGIGAARHLLVPLCPVSVRARAAILKLVAEAGLDLSEVRRTQTYILFAILR